MTPGALFDRSGAVRRPPALHLFREAASFMTDWPRPADPARLPGGGGRPVLLIPGFLAGDANTAPLRRLLLRCGFRAHGWALGPNRGPTPATLEGLRRRLEEIRREAGAPVGLVGVSMGGLLAWDLAHECPEAVSALVTLASPLRLPTASNLEPLVRLLSPTFAKGLRLERLRAAPPVPATAILTRDDGIVAAASCRPAAPGCAVVEVRGPHVTICRNPAAQRAVVLALAQGTAA